MRKLTTAAAASLLAATLALAACTSNSDNAKESPTTQPTPTSEESATTETTAPDSETTSDSESAAPKGADAPAASREFSFKEGAFKVDILPIRDDGTLATVNVVVTNTRSAAVPLVGMFSNGDISIPNSDKQDSTLQNSTRGIAVTDDKNKKIHRAAFDTSDRCLCSRTDEGNLQAGGSTTLHTQVASLPEDVTEVTVTLPGIGGVHNVPVVRD
ncbi:hypothetical protein SAMN02910418_01873 [Bowdeniella nasicola]|uniref:Lipoprotein n=1 Tax=Bowdeniella nasicola TaxID=208480 RepID=A0A1H4C4W2_9ACTO|nr:hypothetical protein [Bowdeniella nasicola]SEA55377.1 hypothetical protein SAMN02910418_01873 [Bowdeniella nasicola]